MVSLRTQSGRLKKHLRELAPPGMDSATYAALVSATEPEIGAPGRFAKLARAKDKLPFGKRSKDPQEIAVDLESAQEELK